MRCKDADIRADGSTKFGPRVLYLFTDGGEGEGVVRLTTTTVTREDTTKRAMADIKTLTLPFIVCSMNHKKEHFREK